MTNEFIEKYVPKKHQDKIENVDKDMDGVWITLKAGYISTSTETRTIHEDTIAKARKQLKTIVEEEIEVIEEVEAIEEVTEDTYSESKGEMEMDNYGTKVIKDFLKVWKENAREYYEGLREEYIIERDKEHEVTPEGLMMVINNYTYKPTYSDEKIEEIMVDYPTMRTRERARIQSNVSRTLYKKWESTHTKKELAIVAEMWNDDFLETLLNKEVESKKKQFIAKVEKKAGTITNAKGLKIGIDGTINGTVIGEKDTVEVETIYAGGYNVQCLHYRILVK